jgi:hypothetical protein
MPLAKLLRSTAIRAKALHELEQVYQEVFGEDGDIFKSQSKPLITRKSERRTTVMNKMRRALNALATL